MSVDIKRIRDKYGDFAFDMAIPYLMEHGKKELAELDPLTISNSVRVTFYHIRSNTHVKPFLDEEQAVQVVQCAAELARIDTIELLKYIQTDMHIAGISIHPGRILSFKNKRTGRTVFTLVQLPSELTETGKVRLAGLIRNKMSASSMYVDDAIKEALDELGLDWSLVTSDEQLVF